LFFVGFFQGEKEDEESEREKEEKTVVWKMQ
jgi:hypothetical protein